ncbi:MAG: hypothetical protein QOF61_1374 [Acidobacteriota bacterium]|jgi:hypothetical protein|nr:hypothetical protein [Acidobacteriota bacterium]
MTRRERPHQNVTLALLIILPLFMASFVTDCHKKTQNTQNTSEDTRDIDNSLSTEVRKRLTDSHQVRAGNMDIRTSNLKVSLIGTVSSEAERDEAIRLAGQTEIVKDGKTFKVKDVDASKLIVKP